jgi:hypothetical protein
MKNKKGISTMIEYVMLIVIVISMSSVVYLWLKGYAPTNEDIECEEGVSVYISNANCITNNDGDYSINLTIKNTGRFSIRGFYVRGTNSSNQTLASIDLSKGAVQGTSKTGNEILFSNSLTAQYTNSFAPENESSFTFIVKENIKKIEITPTRIEKIDGKERLASCQKAIVSEKISCNDDS